MSAKRIEIVIGGRTKQVVQVEQDIVELGQRAKAIGETAARFSIDADRWLLLDGGDPLQSLTGWTRGQVAALEELLSRQDLVAGDPHLAVDDGEDRVHIWSPDLSLAMAVATRAAADPTGAGPVQVVEITPFTRSRLVQEVPRVAP